MEIAEVAERGSRIVAQVERAVVGKREAIELVLMCALADGHVLIEDYPGLAKTLIARSFAAATNLRFGRIQCTPDLLPADITGSSVYDLRSGEFNFREGPVFTNLLLADEINRAHPKSQAALLEAMQEHQVTSDDGTRTLERPFLVLATQNPIEFEGTYPLPEAQLDRFIARLSVGYPAHDDELGMLERRMERRSDEVAIEPVVTREELLEMQAALETVTVERTLAEYIVALVAATRASAQVQVGASPRGTLALMKLGRARAALDGRDFVTPDDIKSVAIAALAHRLALRPEIWVQQVEPASIVRECLDQVPTPAPLEREQ
jgi:MoxR-like ATPase